MAGFGNFTSGKGEASLTVEWQTYSNAQHAVVCSTVQKGYAKLDSSIAGPAAELCRSPGARLRLARPLASVSPSGHYPSAAPANVHTIAQGGQALGRHGPTGFLQQLPKGPSSIVPHKKRAALMAALR